MTADQKKIKYETYECLNFNKPKLNRNLIRSYSIIMNRHELEFIDKDI